MAAYICYKPKGSCKTCEHFRFDEDRGDMACFALVDEKKARLKDSSENKCLLEIKEIGVGYKIVATDKAGRKWVLGKEFDNYNEASSYVKTVLENKTPSFNS